MSAWGAGVTTALRSVTALALALGAGCGAAEPGPATPGQLASARLAIGEPRPVTDGSAGSAPQSR